MSLTTKIAEALFEALKEAPDEGLKGLATVMEELKHASPEHSYLARSTTFATDVVDAINEAIEYNQVRP